MPQSPIHLLRDAREAVWCDEISRALVTSGRLNELVQEADVTGLSSNPTIFERALSADTSYASACRDLDGLPAQIYEHLIVEDVRMAADVLLPAYQSSLGADGYASLQVSPDCAHDAAATVEAARRIVSRVGRPNVMVKVPATDAGLDAFAALIAEGVSVDVTLIFGLDRYAQVIGAYFNGLEQAADEGLTLSRIASVASIFVSRIDTVVDQALTRLAARDDTPNHQAVERLTGRAGVANGRLAYELFNDSIATDRFLRLRAQGANLQRICWSSMSVKNPTYRDVRYVEELVAPDTVADLPVSLIEAFMDHGRVETKLDRLDVDEAKAVMTGLADLGIDLVDVAKDLERQGLTLFARSLSRTYEMIPALRRELV
jgi:transaldolase